MDGAFNNVVLSLQPRTEFRSDVLRAIDNVVGKYGSGFSAHGLEPDHPTVF